MTKGAFSSECMSKQKEETTNHILIHSKWESILWSLLFSLSILFEVRSHFSLKQLWISCLGIMVVMWERDAERSGGWFFYAYFDVYRKRGIGLMKASSI